MVRDEVLNKVCDRVMDVVGLDVKILSIHASNLHIAEGYVIPPRLIERDILATISSLIAQGKLVLRGVDNG